MRSARLLWLSLLLLIGAPLSEARDPPGQDARPSHAMDPPARTTAVVQEPAKQGPSAPLPVQAAPTPPPSAAEQNAQMAQQAAAVEGNPDWAVTLERIASSVVSIDVDSTRAFDTEWNSTAQSTGFIVDAERGLILTNGHVVTPGQLTAEATFLNREEVQLYPVYPDPVHDFAIYRDNPLKLPFLKP